eukprot:GHVS01097745.1.p1 GENE.GHVS01097745.1~~GHVS01097745.1.p1  ORF type:complete len:121 (-),score=22.86 GHVS01097745.1:1169-1531(-)
MTSLWHPLSFYSRPPLQGGTDLAHFEVLAAKRLAVLQLIERKFPDLSSLWAALNSERVVNSAQASAGGAAPSPLREVEGLLLTHDLAIADGHLKDTRRGQVEDADTQSHFILKLAYASRE